MVFHLRDAGYQVLNPCMAVRTFHQHCVHERTYARTEVMFHGWPTSMGWASFVADRAAFATALG